MNIFEKYESNVRSYCRNYTDIFATSKGSFLYTQSGEAYIDFLAGAGALNYGHNNEYIKEKVLEYIASDNVIHNLDMYSVAKMEFINSFYEYILKPKNMDYKMQFCGPTGTNAVEAALKLARKVKNRPGIFAFMGSFHGMSLGSLSITSKMECRGGSGVPMSNVTFLPYPYGFMNTFDTLSYMEEILKDDHSGIEKPAAVILETVQAEGGVIPAPVEWLQRLAKLCQEHDILLICDDIQVGCGRSGNFFSFERAGIIPDMVTISKSISGYGFPMSLLLMRKELDIWKPGEHNGTFRGNQLAFVGAKAALEYRIKEKLEEQVKEKESFLHNYLTQNIASLNPSIEIRGIGMIWGIDLSKIQNDVLTKQVVEECYKKNLIIERVGRNNNVIKILPPLTTEIEVLEKGCGILADVLSKLIL
nr:diaminobutyrate--2-oxoglutarate transaminase [uncultured Clostridium sp.]